jgi:CRISPR-associated protein Cas2
MWYVICYDVREDRRRIKVARTLEDYGDRVQYSVFEAGLTAEHLERLLARLGDLIDPETDSVYVYQQCERCRRSVQIRGRGTAFDEEVTWIV